MGAAKDVQALTGRVVGIVQIPGESPERWIVIMTIISRAWTKVQPTHAKLRTAPDAMPSGKYRCLPLTLKMPSGKYLCLPQTLTMPEPIRPANVSSIEPPSKARLMAGR
jgi:hypothetical protein